MHFLLLASGGAQRIGQKNVCAGGSHNARGAIRLRDVVNEMTLSLRNVRFSIELGLAHVVSICRHEL